MALTFPLVGPIPCLVKRGPMKTILVKRNVHLPAFKVRFFSASLHKTLAVVIDEGFYAVVEVVE